MKTLEHRFQKYIFPCMIIASEQLPKFSKESIIKTAYVGVKSTQAWV